MEVETRPPVVDGQLGFMSSQGSTTSSLHLAISDADILSDEERERELLKSPIDERLSPSENCIPSVTDINEDELLEGDSVNEKCSDAKLVRNDSDSVTDDVEVLRTESDQIKGKENEVVPQQECHRNGESVSNSSSKNQINPEQPEASPTELLGNEILVDANGTAASDIIVEDPGDIEGLVIANSETANYNVSDDRSPDTRDLSENTDNPAEPPHADDSSSLDLKDVSASDCPVVVGAVTLPISFGTQDERHDASPGECSQTDDLDIGNGDVVMGEDELNEVHEGSVNDLESTVVRQGEDPAVDPVSEADSKEQDSAGLENVDEAGMPKETGDVTVLGIRREEESAPLAKPAEGTEAATQEDPKESDDMKLAVGEEAESQPKVDDAPVDDGSLETDPDSGNQELIDADVQGDDISTSEHMDIDPEGIDGSPEYQGMTDEILPIIESELDDQPPEGEGVFDTEVEVDDGSALDEVNGAQDDSADGNETRDGVIYDDMTIETEEDREATRKKLMEQFSSSGRRKLKRRASDDLGVFPFSPLTKKLKRQLSLDDLTGCASNFDKKQFLKGIEEKSKSDVKESSDSSLKEEAATEVKDESESKVLEMESKSSSSGSPLVTFIDLDDEDEKTVKPDLETTEENKCKVEDDYFSQRSKRVFGGRALDALFNGKKEITLNRKMFSKILKAYVNQYMMTLGNIGKATRLSLQGADTMAKTHTAISNYEKQRDDYKVIVRKLIEDREASKGWDESLIPPKTTRSVGLQVCSVGNIFVRKEDLQPLKQSQMQAQSKNTLPNSTNAMLAQKQAYALQQKVQAETQRKRARQQLESLSNRPASVAKKSTGGTMARPASNTTSSPSPVPYNEIPRVNGFTKTVLNRSSVQQQQQLMKPPNAVISPNSKTIMISGKPVATVRSPAKPPQPAIRSTLNPTLQRVLEQAMQTHKSPTAVAAAQKQIPNPGAQPQLNRNLASGPGRPILAKPSPPKSQNILAPPATPQQKKGNSANSDATIDLTDDDGPQSTKLVNALAKRSCLAVQSKPLTPAPALNAIKKMKHPPLPPNPPCHPPQHAPPRPYLGICNTQQGTQGIMLTWHFNNVLPPWKVQKFQVFAYQEARGAADESWKKVGDVDALPLPMACTLTQFREGYTYHFIVRAVDEVGRIGPFSAPNTITLMKKTS